MNDRRSSLEVQQGYAPPEPGPLSQAQIDGFLGAEVMDLIDQVGGAAGALRVKIGSAVTARLLHQIAEAIEGNGQ
jgi:hypothetical protein